jgi:DNA mismatch repair ATPase MutS
MAHFIINSFWLWDIKYAIKAEKWKERNGKHIRSWLEAVGQFEKLSSLAIIHFEHPLWAFPKVKSSEMIFHTKNIKHPLIPQTDNVGNDFKLSKENSIAIITGSNMSGKSTFLRTIAVNLVLAYAGAPVCAEEMTCGIFNIYTSMRKTDDVKGNVSTFYSELLRIKNIVNMANRGINILFLIDEIFNGTNSQDRTTGATAVLNTLQLENTLGIISTHDLKLCNLSDNPGSKYINYHFREYYENNSIKFDYKIYPGPSRTRNAIFLIKMAGIPIKD